MSYIITYRKGENTQKVTSSGIFHSRSILPRLRIVPILSDHYICKSADFSQYCHKTVTKLSKLVKRISTQLRKQFAATERQIEKVSDTFCSHNINLNKIYIIR